MKNIYYLSSLDSTILEKPRKCTFKDLLKFDTSKDAILADIDPDIQIEKNGKWEVIKEIILTHRHEGYELNPIRNFLALYL
jgi:hypothetical protein